MQALSAGSIPLAGEGTRRGGEANQPQIESPAVATYRLLLVEDGDSARHVKGLLDGAERDAYEVHHVDTLQDAVNKLHDLDFDVVLVDVRHSQTRGMDAVSRLKASAPNAALVVLGESSEGDAALQAIHSGAQEYVPRRKLTRIFLERVIRFARERKHVERELTRLVYVDSLTGLSNRKAFHTRLSQQLSRANRTGDPFAVLYVDLDNLKPINDALGHDAGDAVIQEVGKRLDQSTRAYDTVARLGGDEFAVIVDGPINRRELEALTHRMLRTLRRPYRSTGRVIEGSASIGVAIFPEAGGSSQELIKAADSALYAAKAAGKGVIKFFDARDAAKAEVLQAFERDLRSAVHARALRLAYQPIVDMASGQIVAMEALLRWRRPNGTEVSPQEFLPLLESTGMIADAGSWAIRQACKQLRAWNTRGIEDLMIAVNVSPRQFELQDIVQTVCTALDDACLEPHQLQIEVRESVFADGRAEYRDALHRLKGLGVRIVGDGFGTGPVFLPQLASAPIDALKLDASLVTALGSDRESSIQTDVLLGIASRLGLDVIACGVSNDAQLQHLRGEGCTLGQGVLLGPPNTVWEHNTFTSLPNSLSNSKR